MSETPPPSPPVWLTNRQWILVIFMVLLIGTTYMFYSQSQANTGAVFVPIESPIAGYIAPDFTLSTTSGEPIQLSQLRGRPVVLNFWATWCGPCRIETPHFQAISEQFGDEIVVLGVNQQESAEAINRFADEFELTYPLLIDADNHVNQTYAVFGLPTTFFINEDGIIESIAPGAINQAVLEDNINALRR